MKRYEVYYYHYNLYKLDSLLMFYLDKPIPVGASVNESITFQLPAVKCNGLTGVSAYVLHYLNFLVSSCLRGRLRS